MTTDERTKTIETLSKLLESQLLIRATVSRLERKQGYQFCTIELVSASFNLGRNGYVASGQSSSGFVHMQWYGWYEERKGELVSSEFHFPHMHIERASLPREGQGRWLQGLLEPVYVSWEENITGSGARAFPEWLEPKPFRAVASLGHRGEGRTEDLRENARVLLAYYGMLLGKLDAHVSVLRNIEPVVSTYHSGFEDTLELMRLTTERFRSFLYQIQFKEFSSVFL